MNETVASIIIALAAAIPGVMALIANRRKSVAESNSIEIDSLRDTISALHTESKEVRAESKEIRDELDALEKKFMVCKEDLDATMAENAILARRVTALNQSLSDVTQEMFELKRANELLRKAIEDRDRIIAEFREKFERPLGGKA